MRADSSFPASFLYHDCLFQRASLFICSFSVYFLAYGSFFSFFPESSNNPEYSSQEPFKK